MTINLQYVASRNMIKLNDLEFDQLMRIKRFLTREATTPNLAPVYKSLVAICIASSSNIYSLDTVLSKEGRNEFLSWVFDRRIFSSKIMERPIMPTSEMTQETIERCLLNAEAHALLMWMKPSKGSKGYAFNPDYINALAILAKVFDRHPQTEASASHMDA